MALGPSPGRDPQSLLHVLVDHIGDAHGRDDLHEVGGDAPVQARHALLGQDVAEQTQHGELGGALDGGWEGVGSQVRPWSASPLPSGSPGLGRWPLEQKEGGLD